MDEQTDRQEDNINLDGWQMERQKDALKEGQLDILKHRQTDRQTKRLTDRDNSKR